MKKLTSIIIILIALTNIFPFPIYAEKTTYEVEDLGSIYSTTTIDGNLMFRDKKGDTHLVLFFASMNGNKTQLVDVNLISGNTYLRELSLGRIAIGHSTAMHPNGKLYMATGDSGHLSEYDPLTGNIRYISKTIDKGGYYMDIGPDGKIYIGEWDNAYLEVYDPVTDTLESKGSMGSDTVSPTGATLQYAYTLKTDGDYVYVGVGQDPWYLSIYNLKTSTLTKYWDSQKDTGGIVSKAANGDIYYRRDNKSTSWKTKWYKMEDGIPKEVSKSSVPQIKTYPRANVTEDSSYWNSEYGFDINLSDMNPNSNRNQITIKWKLITGNSWKSSTVHGFTLAPSQIKRLYPNPSNPNEFLGFTNFYGPIFRYNPTTNTFITLGKLQTSLYDGIYNNGIWYLSGYPSITLKYDPLKPLNADTLSNLKVSDINPHKLNISAGKYHYYSAIGKNNTLYVAGQHKRDSGGGSLGIFDLNTDENFTIREPFTKYDPSDLIYIPSSNKIVYSGSAIDGTTGKLFIIDNTTKQITNQISPIPGLYTPGKIVEVAPGIILGVTQSKYYKIDINKGKVLFIKDLPGEAFKRIAYYDQRLAKDSKGFIWLSMDGNKVITINPTNGEISIVAQGLPAGNIAFINNVAYVYGTNKIYRLVP